MRLAPALLSLIILLGQPVGAAQARPAAAAKARTRSLGYGATLSHQADGSWQLDYRFRRGAPAWYFLRSFPTLGGESWRTASWRVETPGVTLARIGSYDVLRAERGDLRRVRIRVTPYDRSLKADYSPFLTFSDGGVAVFDGHYALVPLHEPDAAARLPSDLNGVDVEMLPATLAIRWPGQPLLARGTRTQGLAHADLRGEPGYVYAGPARVRETPAYAGIIDPQLPGWIAEELDGLTPRVFALYAAKLGQGATPRPMAMVAWGGGSEPGISFGGSVLPGTVVMRISGRQTVTPSAAIRTRLRWFFGHESAHFWLGQTVRYTRRAEAWITEGGADMLAIRALEALVPGYDPRPELQREVDDCVKMAGAGKPLSGAAARGDVRTNYACGATLLIAVEGARRQRDTGNDLFGWVRAFIDAHRAEGHVSQADWLAAFDAAVADPAARASVRRFLDEGVPDPAAFVDALFAACGVAHRREGDRILLGDA